MYYNSNLYEADSYLVIIIECFCEEWTNTWNWLRGELVAEYKGWVEPIVEWNSMNGANETQLKARRAGNEIKLMKLIGLNCAVRCLQPMSELKDKSEWKELLERRSESNCGAIVGRPPKQHNHQSTQQSKDICFLLMIDWFVVWPAHTSIPSIKLIQRRSRFVEMFDLIPFQSEL